MNLKQAKEVIEDIIYYQCSAGQSAKGDAVKLSLQAINAVLALRAGTPGLNLSLLPGETPPKPLHALGFNTGDDESP